MSPLEFSEPVIEENPPAWVTRWFDAAIRADRMSQGYCPNGCRDHLLGVPCPTQEATDVKP